MIAVASILAWLLVSYFFEKLWTKYWHVRLSTDPHSFKSYTDKVPPENTTVNYTYKLFPVRNATGVIVNADEVVVLVQKDYENTERTRRHELYHITQRRKYGAILFWNLMFVNYVVLFFLPHDKKPMEVGAERGEIM